MHYGELDAAKMLGDDKFEIHPWAAASQKSAAPNRSC